MMNAKFTSWPVCPENATDSVKEFVEQSGGVIGATPYAAGVIDAFNRLQSQGKRIKLPPVH
jgi:hypothetical protein